MSTKLYVLGKELAGTNNDDFEDRLFATFGKSTPKYVERLLISLRVLKRTNEDLKNEDNLPGFAEGISKEILNSISSLVEVIECIVYNKPLSKEWHQNALVALNKKSNEPV